jgi:hypothetical protein
MKEVGRVIKGVGSAMIGVGNKEDLVKNFEQVEKKGPWLFVIIGLLGVVGFIGMILFFVDIALSK